MKNKYLLEKDELPDEKELEKLSEKERKSFFTALLKKQKKQSEGDGADEAQAKSADTAETPVKNEDEKTSEGADNAEKRIADEKAAIEKLAKDKRYAGFSERLGEIKSFLAAFPALEVLEAQVRYELAYLALVGSDALKNANKTPSPAELVEALVDNREAVKLYESVRTAQLAEKNGAIPAHVASKGAASMPANIKNTPKNLNEARKEAYGYFGINY